MEGMSMAPPPSSSSSSMNGTTGGMGHKMMMIHMTLYWGNKAEILFNHWPGDNTPMFVLALFLVFFMSLLVEWLSRSRFIKPGSNPLASGLIQTLMHAIRVGLAYMVMLALMSFNVALLLVAVAGHAVGFFFFASSAFHESRYQKQLDLPALPC